MRAAGMRNGNHKLTPRKVQAVRDSVRLGFTHMAVAKATALASSTVSDISNRRIWRDLPDVPSSEVVPVQLLVEADPIGGDVDCVLLISGNTATELLRVPVVLCRGPLTDEELSRD